MNKDDGEKTILDETKELLSKMVHRCATCKHSSKLITEEPCFDCDTRKGSGKDYWEINDG